MMAVEILKKGHPIFDEPAINVTLDEASEIVNVMMNALVENKHFVGLACNQIGFNKRIVILKLNTKLRVLLNPELVYQEGEQETFEGCGSLDSNTFYKLLRPFKIRVKYQVYYSGLTIEEDFEGKEAWIICHEIDHLDGIFLDDKAIKVFYAKDDLYEEENL